MPPRYFAYYTDTSGANTSSYELKAGDDEQARTEAQYFLSFHPSIQVWQGGRYVGRLARGEPETRKKH
jgi:hypothetical protein